MDFRHIGVLLVVCCLQLCSLHAQSPYRFGCVTPDSMRVRFDTLSVVPQSFQLQGTPSAALDVDFISATLYLRDSALLGKPLCFRYQVYSYDFSAPLCHRPLSLIEPPLPDFRPAASDLLPVADAAHDNLLNTAGSVSRGISVGNRQDLALNSALNLQLSGKLSEDLEIVASLSDQNMPLQPEGNTEYITDLSSVFITLHYKNIVRVDAGDIALVSPAGGFLKVNRSLLGMKAAVSYQNGSKAAKTENSAGGGVSKGKFVQQTIQPQNGVQGPYRLYGPNNETGIAVVAGSERVYVDGELKTRGQDRDYVMDYNTAELTFTPSMLVTEEKRIVVWFECTDRNYVRYSLFSYNEMTFGKKRPLTLTVNYYQEQDLKNRSVQPELDDSQKLFLSRLAAGEETAYYSQADSMAFTADRVLYAKRDTVAAGKKYEVYCYSVDKTEQLYSLSFSYVGKNKGNYVLLSSTANGRVFGWIAPEDGVPQGDYEPVTLLTTPKLQQMATLGAAYRFAPKSLLRGELALSNYNSNTFLKKNGNAGFAGTLELKHEQELKRKDADTARWHLSTELLWQYRHKDFCEVDPSREVEFARKYNLSGNDSTRSAEQMLQASVGIADPHCSSSKYTLNWYSRPGNLSALRQEVVSSNRLKAVQFTTATSWLLQQDTLRKSSFVASNNNFSLNLKKVIVGFQDLLEHNMYRDRLLDTLCADSYAFNEAVLFVKSGDSARLGKYAFYYKNRIEFQPSADSLSMHTVLDELSVTGSLDRIRNQHFGVKATYRNQRDRAEATPISEHYYVGDLEYSGRFWHNFLSLNTYYELGSGMELRRSYTFIKVAKGQGTHVWNDYNGNGVEELDEFEIAAFQDAAEYVKVWLSGTDYINTYNSKFTQSVRLSPAAVWRNAKGVKKFVSRFSDAASFRAGVKRTVPNVNPFYADMADTGLVSRNLSFSNTLSFNSSASKFAFDFMVQENQNKNLLYYGFERNSVSLQQVELKGRAGKSIAFQTTYEHQETENQSEQMSTRSYTIAQHRIGEEVRYQFRNAVTVAVAYSYESKRNLAGKERFWTHSASLNAEGRFAERGTVTTALQYVYAGGCIPESNTASYLMMNGLSLGQNVLWKCDCRISVTEYMQLSLQYEGHKTQGNKTTHTGAMTVKAMF
jgi:hypothetical protein